MSEEKKRRPFHESVVQAILSEDSAGLSALGALIMKTVIPDGHDKIIDAWKRCSYAIPRGLYHDVKMSLLEQKAETEAKAKAEADKQHEMFVKSIVNAGP